MSVVANVAINVDSRNAVSKLRQVESQAKITERAFNGLSSALAAFGAGFAISRVIQDVKELDTNLRRLGTVGGDVAALDKGLGQLSKNLDGVANKAELAAASYQALSAGFTETGANLQVVEAATKAAVGGLVDVTSVVEVTTKTLNAYGLSGEYAIKVTDSISKAIEFGQVQWSDYTSQLGRVAATAALAGVSIDEINAFVAAATKNGATAEVAFTGLSAALATLLKPTKESTEAAAALGIEWNVGGLQAKGFSGLLEDLSKKQDANKTAVAELLGSQEALRGVLAANSKAGKDYQMILEGLGGAAGKTESDFETMKGSLENQLKALDTAFKNLSEALGVAFGPTVISAIQDVAGAVNAFAQVIKSVPQPVADLLGGLLQLAAAAGAVSAAINILNTTTALVTAALIPMRAAIVASTTASVANTAATTANASAFALYANNARTVAAATTAATGATIGLRAAVLALVNPWALLAAGIIAATVALAGYQSQSQKTAAKAKTGTAADVVAARNLSVQKGQEISLLEQQRKTASGQQRASIDRRLRTLRTEQADLQSAITSSTADRPAAAALPPAVTGNGAGAATTGGGNAGKASNEAEKLAKELERSLQLGDQLGTQFARQAALLFEASEIEQKRLQIQFDFEDRAKQIAELKNTEQQTNLNQLNDEIRRLEILKLQTDELKKQLDEYYKRAGLTAGEMLPEGAGAFRTDINLMPPTGMESQAAKVKKELDELLNPINQVTAAAKSMGDAFGASFKGLMSGAMTAQEALASFFQSVADHFLDMAAQMIAKWIQMTILNSILKLFPTGPATGAAASGGFTLPGGAGFADGFNLPSLLPGRANGGPVTGGMPYMVGERGPELFVPGRSGSIVPNNELGGGDNVNVVVNVDAKGTNVEGNAPDARRLGTVISAAVQAELIKQKRPGGLLAV